ncbi:MULTISPECIES: DUF6126 family protein [Streptomyces]|uniref:DUF6126 family protein n=1 Tax=Streptomyces TaxID=1883 RepID=UPI0009FBBD9B|nr:DUF6126 family protein [Streptomyces sp. MOE7]ARH93906.1 hypothetical protein STRMOE7_30530 [Streptomyces sp. MOE7]
MPDHTIPSPTEPPAGAPGSTDAGAASPRRYVETKAPRGVYVRVFIYVVATHVLLAMMSLVVFMAKSK